MSNYRIWPIAVLVVVGLYFFWGDDDQHEAEKTPRQEQPPVASTALPQYGQSPKTQAWTPSGDYPSSSTPYAKPGEYGITSEQTPGQYAPPGMLRFRPNQVQDQRTQGQNFNPHYPTPQGQDYPITTQDPAIQNPYSYQSSPQMMDNYRFRPLDKQQRERRWQGNYRQTPNIPTQPMQPYPYTPAPSYPSRSTESKSLWANSWQER